MRALAAWAAVLLGACTCEAELAPRPEEALRITIEAAPWPDLHPVEAFELRLVNQTSRPLRLEPPVFELLDREGTPSAAVSPRLVPSLVLARPGQAEPGLEPVDPEQLEPTELGQEPDRPEYPTLPPWRGPFVFGPPPGGQAGEEPLVPTEELVERALPERTLAPGEQASGLLYFQTIPEELGPFSLRMRLVDAETGEQLGVALVPVPR